MKFYQEDQNKKINFLWYWLPLLLIFLIWYLYTVNDASHQFIFSSPSKVANTLIRLISSGQLITNTVITVFEAVCGFILGTVVGAIIGLLFWYYKTVAKIAQPYIAALASVPIFAIAPMIIVWFGIGIFSKIMLAFLSCVVVATVQSYQGSMSVEPKFFRLMQMAHATRMQVFRLVVVPSSLIWVINAMKLNIGLALLGAFVGEFISSEQGLGYMIVKASGLYNMSEVLVGVFTLMLIAWLLNIAVEYLEKVLLKYKYVS